MGPVRPFRSGVAEHTTMLCRALARRADVFVESYARQYPARLFPGETDSDPALGRLEDPPTRYRIDSLNPWSWRAALRRIAAREPAAVILPWWTAFWMPFSWYLVRGLAARGIRVVLFCHNVTEHEPAVWKRALSRRVFARADAFVVHTRQDEAELRALRPGARIFVHPHPVYVQFPEPRGRLPRRAGLELLFFGIVRPYKGVDLLIDALDRLRSRELRLTICGEFWSGREELDAQVRERGLSEQVDVIDRYVPEDEAAELFARCDAVVVPYRSATGSGVIPLAYRYGKPVIATRVGGLPDVVVDGETGLLVDPDSPEALARAIDAMSREEAARMVPAIEALAATQSWDGLAESVLEAVQAP